MVVHIAHYNAIHVFIDIQNELDYNTVFTLQRMTILGKLMRIQAWKPFFTPEEEKTIVPVWILLQGLFWHYYKKPFIIPLSEYVGKVLYLDTTSIKWLRAGMGKEKIKIDLTKPRPIHVWIGLHPEDNTIGFLKQVEYENSPPNGEYYKH